MGGVRGLRGNKSVIISLDTDFGLKLGANLFPTLVFSLNVRSLREEESKLV